MNLSDADLRYLLTKLGANTGMSLIRPSGYTANQALDLRNRLEAERDRRKGIEINVANN